MLLSSFTADPLLVRLTWSVGSLLGTSLLALVIMAHGHWARLRTSVLFARWCTWAAIAVGYSAAVLVGGGATAAGVAALGALGSLEYGRLMRLARSDRGLLVGAAVVVPFVLLQTPGQAVAGLVLAPALGSLPALVQQDVHDGVRRACATGFGLTYLSGSLGALILLVREPSGQQVVLAVGLRWLSPT